MSKTCRVPALGGGADRTQTHGEGREEGTPAKRRPGGGRGRETGGRGSFMLATRSRDDQADNWVRGELRAGHQPPRRTAWSGGPAGQKSQSAPALGSSGSVKAMPQLTLFTFH